MTKKILLLFSLLIWWSSLTSPVVAIYDPTMLPNNKFGIHILDAADIEAAANLVNSADTGPADWGYLTLVIQDDDRDVSKWSMIFERIRKYHLIPIVRLATHGGEGNIWVKPKEEDVDTWVKFLDALPWPVKNRYVIVFNEVNHAREFGGSLAPDEYARLAVKIADTLHAQNGQFFVLPAGFDVYADGISGTMEATRYWRLMDKEVPGVFSHFDGWTSHAYPKKDFSGSPNEWGRYSIKSYLWELNYLANHFKVRHNLPVFITETGWSQKPGLSREQIAQYFQIAFEDVWTEENLVAVTPFLLSYPAQPFVGFSWKKADGSGFFPQYDLVKSLTKIVGEPLTVPFSKFGEILVRAREEKLAKKYRITSFLYPKPN